MRVSTVREGRTITSVHLAANANDDCPGSPQVHTLTEITESPQQDDHQSSYPYPSHKHKKEKPSLTTKPSTNELKLKTFN